MLTEVQFTNPAGAVLKVPLSTGASTPSGFQITNIEGLEPPKAAILTSSFPTMDGDIFESSRLLSRNVIIDLGFAPDYQSSDPYGSLRRQSYDWFRPGTMLLMTFLLSNAAPMPARVVLVGYVESYESMMFSADPTVKISVICPDPLFSAPTPSVINRTGTGPMTVVNPGTEWVGMTFLSNPLRITGSSPGWVINRTSPGDIPNDAMSYSGELVGTTGSLDMVLKVVTSKGSKSAKATTSLNYGADPTIIDRSASVAGYLNNWLQLPPGTHTISVNVQGSFSPNTVVTTVSWIPRWMGL